ncbi:NAD(P)H-dependent oxidoreductase [Clostridium aestuarii]|uniref:NAD(P)H-dependent oxidoreductase n=1 Tax=Clostridium aestuarii TaxID=338193 RepID=A0ABT4CYA9_9CLOT|nr:NAD(P)H-dependent oxidoreductase [Clostridium aestuarii]MCY6483963.1 NAD(P)H-dependent oxidoreductase [Clostridium aestuarii]
MIYCPCHSLIKADGIIFASPVYACQITGAFKRVIERFSYLFHILCNST